MALHNNYRLPSIDFLRSIFIYLIVFDGMVILLLPKSSDKMVIAGMERRFGLVLSKLQSDIRLARRRRRRCEKFTENSN